jgi:hypothetical protein
MRKLITVQLIVHICRLTFDPINAVGGTNEEENK